jgi:hypothetical protein
MAGLMRAEDSLLFLCARQDFAPAYRAAVLDLCQSKTIAWDEVFDTAKQHAVAPLVGANLENVTQVGLHIPPDVSHRFQLCTYGNVVAKRKRAERLQEGLALLEALAVDVMALKSVALDLLVYDEAWYTTSGDADLVLRPRRSELGPEELVKLEQLFSGRGVEYDFLEHHDVTMNGLLPVDFDRIWHDACDVSFHGHRLYLMSAEDLLLSLCINSCRKRFFRLRSLVDIAETVARLPDLDWALFTEKAMAYECNNIAFSALVVTQTALGCDLPEGALTGLEVGRARSALLRHLSRFLLQWLPLSALSFYAGWELFGRKVGWSLVLPYATYRRQQVVQSLRHTYVAWKSQNS